MVRKFKPRGHNSQLENMRVHLIPSEMPEVHGPEQENELIEIVAKIVQLGRSGRRKKKVKEIPYAA